MEVLIIQRFRFDLHLSINDWKEELGRIRLSGCILMMAVFLSVPIGSTRLNVLEVQAADTEESALSEGGSALSQTSSGDGVQEVAGDMSATFEETQKLKKAGADEKAVMQAKAGDETVTVSETITAEETASETIAAEEAAAEAITSTVTDTAAPTQLQYPRVYAATEEEIRLLASLIYCEAGNQSYEGMVAVGNVVMERIFSDRFPSSMREVIYQKGQFVPAGNGWLNRVIAGEEVPQICYQAAGEALSGNGPAVGYLFFMNKRLHHGMVIGAHVFFGKA